MESARQIRVKIAIIRLRNSINACFVFLFLYSRAIGYIPSNYVKEKELIGLQKYEYALSVPPLKTIDFHA